MTTEQLKRNIIQDFAVECGDEFDQNFVRKAFFDRPWAPVKVPDTRGSLMLRIGALRSSLHYLPTANGLLVTSDTPYASIHNEGGVIRRDVFVTDKMRRWAWARYRATKDEQYKGLALTRKQTIRQTIRMPQRRFVGDHPTIRKRMEEVARNNIEDFANQLIKDTLK